MTSQLLDAASIDHDSRRALQKQENLLALRIEELASLRFTIILTAKWETSASEDMEQRSDLRADLVVLRREYSHKIDEIAMTCGVQQAINAKEEVERTVSLPLGIDMLNTPSEGANRSS